MGSTSSLLLSDQTTSGIGRQANVTERAFLNCGLAENAALPRCERSVTAQVEAHFSLHLSEIRIVSAPDLA
jgi:hypothetical protein